MRERPTATGWCPSVKAIVSEPWWPGRFIYDFHTYENKDGETRTRQVALCPFCGKWVAVRSDMLIAHEPPGGSDARRVEKSEAAEQEYGKLAALDAMSAVRVA